MKTVVNRLFEITQWIPFAHRRNEGWIAGDLDDLPDHGCFFRHRRGEEIAIDVRLDGKTIHQHIEIVQLETLIADASIQDHPGAESGAAYQAGQQRSSHGIDDGADAFVVCYCLYAGFNGGAGVGKIDHFGGAQLPEIQSGRRLSYNSDDPD